MIFRFVANDSSEMLTITCGKEDVVYGCNDTFVVLSGNITTFTIPEQTTSSKGHYNLQGKFV